MKLTSLHRLLVLTAALLLVSCSQQSDTPLRIGLNAWPGYEFLHLARVKGFFAAEGVNVRLIEFTASSDLRRAFDRGQLDGGTFSLFETMRVRDASRRDLRAMLVIDFSDGADAVLARPGLNSVEELRGRRVGLESDPLSIYLLTRALGAHGMTVKDVQMVVTREADMAERMANGEFEAVVTYPPTRTTMERAGHARAIFSSADIPGEIVDVLALDQATLAARHDDVVRLVRAFYRAVEYAKTHPDEALRIMAEREHLTVEEFSAALNDGMRTVELAEQPQFLSRGARLESVVQRADKILRATGHLSGPDRTAEALAPEPASLAAASRS